MLRARALFAMLAAAACATAAGCSQKGTYQVTWRFAAAPPFSGPPGAGERDGGAPDAAPDAGGGNGDAGDDAGDDGGGEAGVATAFAAPTDDDAGAGAAADAGDPDGDPAIAC